LTDVRHQLRALWELQQIDLKVLEFEKAAATIPDQIAVRERELEVLRTELGALNAEADTLRKEQRDTEATIRDDSAKAQKWKRRLIDIRTPREYQALSREAEQLERQIRDLEERVLALMTDIEARDKVIAEKNEALREVENTVAAAVRKLRQSKLDLEVEATKAAEGRSAKVAELGPNLVKRYDKVRGRRQGVAVALLSGPNCSGCNVEVRPQLVVEIRKLETIEACPMCQRILVIPSLVDGTESA
jgi:predicted  nucleic acid-binding Zn-ribbon protein